MRRPRFEAASMLAGRPEDDFFSIIFVTFIFFGVSKKFSCDVIVVMRCDVSAPLLLPIFDAIEEKNQGREIFLKFFHTIIENLRNRD